MGYCPNKNLKEFKDKLTEFGAETKLVIDTEIYEGFPSRNLRKWFETKKKFNELHDSNWNIANKLSKYFSLIKIKEDVLYYQTNIKFDIIYFDAFSPEKQAEMWSEEILNKMFDFLKCGGFLVTYCAKGIIKRRLQKVGFKIISLPGPTGKREMTMAMKK